MTVGEPFGCAFQTPKMTPLRTCGIVLMVVITLFVLLLLIVAATRVLKSPIQQVNHPEQDVFPVDLLITDKNTKLTMESIQHDQSVVLAPAMSVLVYRGNDEDGFYIVDKDRQLCRVNRVDMEKTYLIDVGKHRGIQFHPKRPSLPTFYLLRDIFSQDTCVTLTEDTASAFFVLQDTIQSLTLYTSFHVVCILTIINQTNYPLSLQVECQGNLGEKGKEHEIHQDMDIPPGKSEWFVSKGMASLLSTTAPPSTEPLPPLIKVF